MRTALIALLALALGSCAREERFPAAPILIVCPWSAGGGTDRVARQLAVLLEQDLGVPVNVVNATGGDGVTGHSRGALARPDGYSLTLVTSEIATLHWRGMTSISHRDFAPVGLVNRDAGAIFVRADAPWRTLSDLAQAIRDAPGTLRASGTATAGIWHLGLAGWLSTVGIKPTDVIWVSIAGSAPSLQELMAGGVDLVSCSLPEAQSLLAAGRIRSLGVMAEGRVPRFPDVPTFQEQGVDWTLGTLRGLAVPQDTPPARVRVLADAVRRVVEGDAYRSALAVSGFTPAYEDPVRFGASLEEIDRRLGALLLSDAFRGLAVKRFGPMFFPAVLVGALVLATLGILLAGDRSLPATGADGAPSAASAGAAWRFTEVLLFVALYVALAETAGFILTAAALLLAHLLRLGTRPAVAVPLALTLAPAAYHVFAVVLRVPLPAGMLGW
ncbi:MAG TPA: tripartite tricarboxylate transporter substrate-binding protein [Vicinamibacteria bacterium]|nr:tripartite tricarboxylate transporter substrate-binding protein [Vicinamibacteria bacterium]